MILLSAIIATFEADYLARYGETILPSQLNALHALKRCRTSASPASAWISPSPRCWPSSCKGKLCQ